MLLIGSNAPMDKELLDSIKDVKEWGGNAFQIFIGNPQTATMTSKTKINSKEFDDIRDFCKTYKMQGVIHSSYKINLSNPINQNQSALNNLIFDMNACGIMNLNGVIVHMGSQINTSSYQEAFHNFIDSIIWILDKTEKAPLDINKKVWIKPKLILETSAGEGSKIGKKIDDLIQIFKKTPKKYQQRLRLCIDTAHIWAAGECINERNILKNYIDKITENLGIKIINTIHLNDSGVLCNSGIDRHAAIGEGYIFNSTKGKQILRWFINWCKIYSIPIILETHGDYKKEIEYIKQIMKNNQKGGDSNSTKDKIISVLTDLKQYYSAAGDRFRVGAYQKAIHTIKKIDKPIQTIDDVKGLPGIGKSILGKIEEILQKGDYNTSKHKDKDAELLEKITSIYGIGPVMGKRLIKDHNLLSFPDFLIKVKSGEIKLSYSQKMGLKYNVDLSKRIPRDEVKTIGETIKRLIKSKPDPIPIKEYIIAGSYAMNKADSGDVDIIISVQDDKSKLEKMDLIPKILNKLGDKVVAVMEEGKLETIILFQNEKEDWVRHVDIKISPNESLPFFKFYFCSGVNFNKEMRQKAKELGYKLNQYGIWKNNKRLDIKTEHDIFKLLGEEYKPYKNR